MTALQLEPSAHAPWTRTMFGRAFISGVPSWSCLVAILRREAAAGVSAALLHFADACCAAGVAIPPVLPAGKEPRNFGLETSSSRASASAEIIQLPPATPPLADRTWVLLTGAPEGGWGLGGHANTNAELVSAARAQIAELGKNSPGTSPSSRPPGPA